MIKFTTKTVIKKSIIFLFIFYFSSPLYAVKFLYSYKEGDQYRFLSHVKNISTLNNEQKRESNITNRISFKVQETKDLSGRLAGEVLSSEERQTNEKDENGEDIVASLWSSDYKTDFWRDEKGNCIVDPIYYMPMVRGLPYFSGEDIEVGKKWVSRGEDVLDIRGIMAYNQPFHIPFTAFYEYKGTTVFEKTGETVHIIAINYEYKANFPNYKEKTNDANKGDPLFIKAKHSQNIYWSVKISQPISYDETYETSITFRNNDVYTINGNADASLIEAVAMDKNATENELNKDIEQAGLENMKVEKTDDGVKIVLDDIQFKENSSQFLPNQEEKLKKIGELLAKQKRDVKITGHTASTGKPDNEKNLSERRALAVANYLIKNSYRSKESLITEGQGSSKPIADNKTAEGKLKNRRVEILIMEN